MFIQYKIHRLLPNIFLVVVPDEYERSMLFLRVQEYSESPNANIRGKSFDILDFIKWYTLKNDNAFTYAEDWNGFNISFKSAMECYKKLPKNLTNKYDRVFMRILTQVSELLSDRPELAKKAYIIGAESTNSVTAHHEIYHALYFTDAKYRSKANKAIDTIIPTKIYKKLRANLVSIGYFDNDFTIYNELQAYLRGRDWDHPDLIKGISRQVLRNVHRKLASALKN